MPKIEVKEPTLNGQAYVIKYADRATFYLRVNRGGKKYTNVSLDTADIKQAHKNALPAYVKVEGEPPKSKTRKLDISKACEAYLEEKAIEVLRGQLAPRSQDLYRQRIYQRILPFCRVKGIRSIGEINKNTFQDYAGHFLDVTQKGKWHTETKGLSTGTINSDITTLKAILNWMVEREMLDPKKKPDLKKLKDRKNYRDEANPAFLPEDWKKFCHQLYAIENGIDDPETLWKRRWFVQWVRFQYQSGCRPHETKQIRVGDYEIVRRKDGKVSGILKISNTTKTGGREVAMNGHTLKNIRSHLTKGIKIRNNQIEQHNQKVIAGEVKDKKGNVVTTLLPLITQVTKDDLLMMNPFFEERNVYHMEHIRQWFNRVLVKCDFDRKYTLYSLRSTHISFALLQGQRVNLVAKNCGTSLAMIQKTYDGLSSRFHVDSLGFFQEPVPRDGDDFLVQDAND
jgi:integrase